MVHLNDSKSELGSRLDRHEHLGAGRIGVVGLRHLLCHPALAHATYYLETPGMDEGYDAVNVARAYDIAAGPAAGRPAARGDGRCAAAGRGPGRRAEVAEPSAAVERRERPADRRAVPGRSLAVAIPVGLLVLAAAAAPAEPRDARDVGRGPGPRHARRCGPSSATASCRCSARRPRSATSTTARSTTTCSSPAAFLTGGDSPLAVTVAHRAGRDRRGRRDLVARAVDRRAGGGLVAGLAMAVSASAVEESTFIWNPNLIALSSAIALAGAWHAWTSGRPRWWLLAGVGTGRDDAVPCPRRHAAADRRGAPRRRRATPVAGRGAALGLAVRAGRRWRSSRSASCRWSSTS